LNRDRIYSKGEFIGPYQVDHVLATGGMGILYKATPDPKLRSDLLSMGIQEVVIKMMRLDETSMGRHERKQWVERMDREFKTLFRLSRLGHPNVVRVYDAGRENGIPYYAMEFVDGVTLQEALEQQPRWGQILSVYAKLCGAVAFLHEGGICHRDLKLSNVLVRRHGGDPVLIDFGICLPPSQRTLTGAKELLGTLQYLSPEYAAHWLDGELHTPYVAIAADDVWALGVILYEILTGRTPWITPPDRREDLLREIQDAAVPHPCAINPKAPAALADAVMKLLEPDFNKRPANGTEVLKLIGPAAEQSEVLGRVPKPMATRTTQARKTQWRHTGQPATPRNPQPQERKTSWSRFQVVGLTALAVLGVILLTGLWIHDSHTESKFNQLVSQTLEAVNRLERSSEQRRKVDWSVAGAANSSPGWMDGGVCGPGLPSFANSSQVQGGTAMAQLLRQATLMPTTPFPGQRSAPCPSGAVEVNGLCWIKLSFTPAQVQAGACESSSFYEPSKGSCNTHMVAYTIVFDNRQNNTVDGK